MRSRRLFRGLLPPLALLALVATLGTLQYRWLGQVSQAERDQLRESLDRRARDFAEEFDREVTRVHQGLQPGSAPFDPTQPEPFVRRYEQWLAAATAPAIVKTVYFAKATQKDFELSRFDPETKTFSSAAWPPALDAVRRRLSGDVGELPATGARATKVYTFSNAPLVIEVPAIVISLPMQPDVVLPRVEGARSPLTDHNFMMALRLSHSHVIVELDAAYLKEQLIPALVTRHFSEAGTVRYRVAVVDAQSQPIAARNLPEGGTLDPARADVTAPFFTVRPEVVRNATVSWMAPAPAGSARAAGSAPPAGMRVVQPLTSVTSQFSIAVGPQAGGAMGGPVMLRSAAGHWRVLVQHGAGSLDAAVEAARRRNLWLSFGILAVLAASAGLIVVNARRSERLAAQQMDFVATVSHELRTPLAVIRSAAQNLAAGVVHEPGQAQRYGDLIEAEGRRLTDMVEQVLEYAGLEANRRQAAARAVDVGGVVTDVVSSCSALFQAEGFETVTNIAADTPLVLADEGAIRRALHNLLTNALKYAAAGRFVRVDVAGGTIRGRREAQIVVSDRGPGIAAEDLAHIFEPFYRGRYATERQIHGNGLGLSLVKRIAEAHGGRVTVKSAPGAGTSFTIHLPAAPADTVVQPLEPAADAGGPAA
jgi:signal transduction histidine kinase